ncbi:Na(+)-translocating NADH-quinone reductase subunit A [Pseudooceanicola algae]|uniref:Na(+)-translocating NADH-quinone reductase subunit A n=1 Tax=Pseudooceanicola algae TaxID=1537215 RepID=A0A418SD34_9RHOB|nr:Na(+)-translocating NADH-quinone reductase subunit A [Pseudooceanicola algae]QPM92308.1 Na(+)-translocating NADH-quinone reductase subunit A [Pseudooceanicola algae]
MLQLAFRTGLTLPFQSPPPGTGGVADVICAEAGIVGPSGTAPRVTLHVEEGASVAQGAPVASLRDAPDVCFVAPMSASVARSVLLQGHKLSEIVLFREPGGDVLTHDTSGAATEAGLRRLMQRAGFWSWVRRRPFGGMPGADERPAAIFVMAADTRPFSPDPRLALEGRDEDFGRGLRALALIAEGPVYLCQQAGPPLIDTADVPGLRIVTCGRRHPQAAAGLRMLTVFPAGLETPVWDIHAEDVAALGTLIDTGQLPMTRLVSVAGSALRESRMVRTQVGAHLRGLTHRIARPGPHTVLSGSPLEGRAAQWLAPRDRQVTVLPRKTSGAQGHWLMSALTRSASPKPVIPTAALDQAFGGMVPAAAFVRALSCGDDETAMKLGVLSLLEEDIALADYVLGGEAHLPRLLAGMLDRIRTEAGA